MVNYTDKSKTILLRDCFKTVSISLISPPKLYCRTVDLTESNRSDPVGTMVSIVPKLIAYRTGSGFQGLKTNFLERKTNNQGLRTNFQVQNITSDPDVREFVSRSEEVGALLMTRRELDFSVRIISGLSIVFVSLSSD